MGKHSLDFWLTSEDLPDPNNRVTVNRDGEIVLQYKPNNEEGHKRLIKKLEGLMQQQTKCSVHGHECHEGLVARNLFLGQRIPLAGVAHQNGTVRFGDDPKTSALDRNCKAHELDNLYVVDGGFFCSSGAVNPALTIMADFMGVVGGYLYSIHILHIDQHHYWKNSESFVQLFDLFSGIFKSVFLGGAIALVSCYRGFNCTPGAEGVGRARRRGR